MTKLDIFYIAIILVLCVCVRAGCNESKRAKDNAALLAATQDTLKITRNSLGQEKATTTLLYGNVKDLKKMHVSDTSALGKLQKLVDNLTISVTYLSNVTAGKVTGKTIVTIHDTIYKNGMAYVYPEYKFSFVDRWQDIKSIATKDSTHIDYKVFNEFDLKQNWQRDKWYKRRTPVASILNLNPHTETREMKVFTVKEDKGNRWRDAIGGFIVGALAVEGLHVLNVQIPIRFK